MSRVLLVEGDKTFRITIPDDAKITFAPFSPPKRNGYARTPNELTGTLRIYQGTKDNIIAMFTDVASFRELTAVSYEEMVVREEGAAIWKSDEDGYKREEQVKFERDFVADRAALPAAAEEPKRRRIRKPKEATA